MVTVANIHDSKATYLLMRVLNELCSSVKTIMADGGYRGQLAENIRDTFGYVLQVISLAIRNKGLDPLKSDGLLNEHLLGSIIIGDYTVITKQLLTQRKKLSKLLL